MIAIVKAKFLSKEFHEEYSYTKKNGEQTTIGARYHCKFLVEEKEENWDYEELDIFQTSNELVEALLSLTGFEDVTLRLDISFQRFGNTEIHKIEILDITKILNN